MSGNERAFDDGRFPDEEGYADCFICGKKIDPRDPKRGTYTMNRSAFDGLPCHLPCVFGQEIERTQVAFMCAMNTMSDANMKQALHAARVATRDATGR